MKFSKLINWGFEYRLGVGWKNSKTRVRGQILFNTLEKRALFALSPELPTKHPIYRVPDNEIGLATQVKFLLHLLYKVLLGVFP